MGDVTLTINDKNYGIACDEGQEERVAHLGHYIDARLKEIAGAGGAISDSHLLVLTALVIADESQELREQMQNMVPADGSKPKQIVSAEQETQIVQTIDHMANRINDLTARLQSMDKAA